MIGEKYIPKMECFLSMLGNFSQNEKIPYDEYIVPVGILHVLAFSRRGGSRTARRCML